MIQSVTKHHQEKEKMTSIHKWGIVWGWRVFSDPKNNKQKSMAPPLPTVHLRLRYDKQKGVGLVHSCGPEQRQISCGPLRSVSNAEGWAFQLVVRLGEGLGQGADDCEKGCWGSQYFDEGVACCPRQTAENTAHPGEIRQAGCKPHAKRLVLPRWRLSGWHRWI